MVSARKLAIYGIIELEPQTEDLTQQAITEYLLEEVHENRDADLKHTQLLGDNVNLSTVYVRNGRFINDSVDRYSGVQIGQVLNSHELHLDLATGMYESNILSYAINSTVEKHEYKKAISVLSPIINQTQGTFAAAIRMSDGSFLLWAKHVTIYVWISKNRKSIVFSTSRNPFHRAGEETYDLKNGAAHFYTNSEGKFIVDRSYERRKKPVRLLLCSGGENSLEQLVKYDHRSLVVLHYKLGQEENTDALLHMRKTKHKAKLIMPGARISETITHGKYNQLFRKARLGWLISDALMIAEKHSVMEILVGCDVDKYSAMFLRSLIDYVNFASAGRIRLSVPTFERSIGKQVNVVYN